MALTTCHDCGKDVSTRAAACPHFGCPTTTKCPECGKAASSLAVSCSHCGCPLISSAVPPPASYQPEKGSAEPGNFPAAAATKQMVTTSRPDETLGTFLIMIPLAAAGLVFFWVGSMRMIDGPWSKLSLLAVCTVLLTAGLVSMEAQRLGFANDPRRPRSERDGPVLLRPFGSHQEAGGHAETIRRDRS